MKQSGNVERRSPHSLEVGISREIERDYSQWDLLVSTALTLATLLGAGFVVGKVIAQRQEVR